MVGEKSLIIVLPELDGEGHSHYGHYLPLIRALSRRARVALVIERPHFEAERLRDQLPGVELHLQKRSNKVARAAELLLVMNRLRRRGFRASYGSYSRIYGLIAGTLGRLTGMRVSYWHCRGDIAEEHRLRLGQVVQYVRRTVPLVLTVHLVHQVVTGTPNLARLYAHVFHLDPTRVRVVPNDVDPQRFLDIPVPARPSGQPVVLYVGRLSVPKGAHLLGRIFSGVHARLPNARFVVAGGGPEETRLRRELAEAMPNDRVQLLGYVPNTQVSRLMREADVLVMPSLEEGFPRRLLEAMACELPFVASDVGGVREVVGPQAQRHLVPSSDVDAAVCQVLSLLGDGDRLSELAAEGLQQLQNYSVERVAPLFLSVMTDQPQ